MAGKLPHTRPLAKPDGVVRPIPGGPRKCMPRAEERVTKLEFEDALRRAGLDGHRKGSFAAYWIGVSVSCLHGWRNPRENRYPTRHALDRVNEYARMAQDTERFLRVVGAK